MAEEEGESNEFPKVKPSQINWFKIKDDDKIDDEGYDSEGDLMYFIPTSWAKKLTRTMTKLPLTIEIYHHKQ